MDANCLANNVHASDSLAFLLIMLLAARSRRRGLKVQSIMETIATDAMRYFLVIFSAHFVLVMTLNLGPVRTTVPRDRPHLTHYSIGIGPTPPRPVSRTQATPRSPVLILVCDCI